MGEYNVGEGQRRDIQWFPGHMAKTRRKIGEQLKLVDAAVELIDARIPAASRNPELAQILGRVPRLTVLTKADMADEQATRRWVEWLEQGGGTSDGQAGASRGQVALAVDAKTGRGFERFAPAVERLLADKIASWRAKGMKGRAVRLMIVGIPNVGKSSFINRLAPGKRARVEDRPGVTRGNQWFSLPSGMLMLDTPGVLWPKFEDQDIGRLLAYTGAIRDTILDTEELACGLLALLAARYAPLVAARYKLDADEVRRLALEREGWPLLERVARARGMLIPGGEADIERAAVTVLDEYRGAKIGRITLEEPSGQGG